MVCLILKLKYRSNLLAYNQNMSFCQVSKLLWALSLAHTILLMISNWQIHWLSQVCPQCRAQAHKRCQDQAQLRASLWEHWASHTQNGVRGNLENTFSIPSTLPEVPCVSLKWIITSHVLFFLFFRLYFILWL